MNAQMIEIIVAVVAGLFAVGLISWIVEMLSDKKELGFVIGFFTILLAGVAYFIA